MGYNQETKHQYGCPTTPSMFLTYANFPWILYQLLDEKREYEVKLGAVHRSLSIYITAGKDPENLI